MYLSSHNVYYGNKDKNRRTTRSGTSPTSTFGLSAQLLSSITGAHEDTARRWKRSGSVPRHFADIVALRTTGDLGIVCEAWRGFALLRGELWTPDGWGPITPGDMTAIPIRVQHIRHLEQIFDQLADRVQL